MKPFVNDYVEMMSPADGKAAERLGIPEFTITIDDDDDECVVLGEIWDTVGKNKRTEVIFSIRKYAQNWSKNEKYRAKPPKARIM